MRVSEIVVNHDSAPVAGCGLYVVLSGETARRARGTVSRMELFYPFTLQTLAISPLLVSEHKVLWSNEPDHLAVEAPYFSVAKLQAAIERIARQYGEMGREFRDMDVRRVLAGLTGREPHAIASYRSHGHARGISAKRPGIIEALFDLLRQTDAGYTIPELVELLHVSFPDREPEKMLVTVRTQLSRNKIPATGPRKERRYRIA